jgi:hypothetical protein
MIPLIARIVLLLALDAIKNAQYRGDVLNERLLRFSEFLVGCVGIEGPDERHHVRLRFLRSHKRE